METLIQTTELACGYGTKRVVSGVCLDIKAGEVLVLIGPNGSGKTTLLHTLARLLKPLEGTVEVQGKPAKNYSASAFARLIALAPQRATQSSWPLTVREAVSLGRAPHRGWLLPLTRGDKEAVEAAMVHMGIDQLGERLCNTLSGGEVRRVILARALAQAPRVLLLDEPATYLDLHYQAELLGAARKLAHQDGLAVVMTVHDLPLAALCADRIAVLAPGKLCALGRPEEVLREEILKPVYGENLEVFAHPKTGKPLVFPLTPTLF